MLEGKDVRSKLEPDAHAVLLSEAEFRGIDLSELVREVLETYALGLRHRHTLLAKRMESAGLLGKHRAGGGL